MTTRISPTLVAVAADDGQQIRCVVCGERLSTIGADPHWKHRARLTERRYRELPGWSASVHPDLLLRQFSCPGCGHLLDSETALPEDPFLYDIVAV